MNLEQLGLLRSGMLDYPGRVAATIFTMGCPLRCPYCHNPELLHGSPPDHFIPRSEVLKHLRKRSGILQGVVITGGEPLMHRDLPELIEEISRFHYDIKLDTSGYYPDALGTALTCEGVQFVAMDLKTSPGNYGRVEGGTRSGPAPRTAERILRSITNLRDWKKAAVEGRTRNLEFRTTCAPKVVTENDLVTILELLEPGESWVLQNYRPADRTTSPEPDNDPLHKNSLPIGRQAIDRIIEQAKHRGVFVSLRGFQPPAS
ncbi:anaerobic ribonucleoside-triphosphate reductase activating protein [Spirochaeta dissipatitropha]